ncbi:hypothetical protein [Undibacterium sp.]|uniref:hypothetical protein n=1 Tax=Undibacterium sp. TaxID=1914977 RepID=UPI00272F2F91|nr:hypothetical protein [Undibacterium sp.]MDP1979534.1 hypothetical protein [Undibacterium sp.]
MLEMMPSPLMHMQAYCKYETQSRKYENFLSGAAVSKRQMFSVKHGKEKVYIFVAAWVESGDLKLLLLESAGNYWLFNPLCCSSYID